MNQLMPEALKDPFLINAGMNGTEKSRNIKIYATADNIAVTVRYLTFDSLFLFLFTVACLCAHLSLVSFSV